MQKAGHGWMLGSRFITFSSWFLKTLFTLLKTFVKQMEFFLCYSYSVTHICSIIYRNHEVLPKPQMSEEFNYNVDALSPLGANMVKGRQGVIYLWAKLPSGAVEVVCKKTWGMFVFYLGMLSAILSKMCKWLKSSFTSVSGVIGQYEKCQDKLNRVLIAGKTQ